MGRNLRSGIDSIATIRVRKDSPRISEASIASLGPTGFYNVELRNGVLLRNIPGDVGLAVGTSVVIASYSGTGRHVIIGTGYKNWESITTVDV